jgi:hypothetical protein
MKNPLAQLLGLAPRPLKRLDRPEWTWRQSGKHRGTGDGWAATVKLDRCLTLNGGAPGEGMVIETWRLPVVSFEARPPEGRIANPLAELVPSVGLPTPNLFRPVGRTASGDPVYLDSRGRRRVYPAAPQSRANPALSNPIHR